MNNDIQNILLITPYTILAEGLKAILETNDRLLVSAIIPDISDYNEILLKKGDPDLVILDPAVMDYPSRKNCKTIIGHYTDAPLIAFPSVPMNDENTDQFAGIIHYYDTRQTILSKVMTILSSESNNKKQGLSELSSREKEILKYVAQGMLNKEIAFKLNLSVYTVITHRKNITRKTGIKTVAGLTVYALLNNIIDSSTIE